jgi:hypothetical protein
MHRGRFYCCLTNTERGLLSRLRSLVEANEDQVSCEGVQVFGGKGLGWLLYVV